MKYDCKVFEGIKYVIMYPKEYKSSEKYPILYFLHGAGTRGDNINNLPENPFFKIIEKYEKFPFVIVANISFPP